MSSTSSSSSSSPGLSLSISWHFTISPFSMDPPSPPEAPPLTLPPAALHATRPDPPHPDSAEFQHDDRFRSAEEMVTLSGEEDMAQNTTSNSSLHSRHGLPRQFSEISTAADDTSSCAQQYRLVRQDGRNGVWDTISKIWKREVSVSIDEGSHRDHLALERTFLGYLRTSLAFAITGVLTAQLLRLQHNLNPNIHYGFFVLGIPLAVVFLFAAMIVLALGAYRFWRQQRALVRGRVWAGGWEVLVVMGMSVLVAGACFLLVVAVDVHKEYFEGFGVAVEVAVDVDVHMRG